MAVPISNVTRRVVYAASGTGPYAFTFEILAETDIEVYKGDTKLTLTTDYSVTINANGTGSVTLVATAGTDNITIIGARAIQRTTDFVTGGDLFANTINDELDSLTIFAQQNSEAVSRALQAPETDPTTINMTLPRKADRADKYLAFDSDGNPVPGQVPEEITAVLAIEAEIIAVAAIDTEVTAVAGVTGNIETLAPIAADITTVAGISSSVTTVAGLDTEIAAVVANEGNIDIVAGIDTEIAALGPIATSIQAVGNLDAADLQAVGNIETEVVTVAGVAGNIETLAPIAADITTAAGISGNIETVAGISSDVTGVAGISAAVSAVNSNSTNINTVATDLAGSDTIGTVAGIAANVTSVAGIAANVTTVAGISSDVTIVATNVADITNFSDVYLGPAASDPATRNDSSALQAGDLYFNTVDDAIKVYTGSAWTVAYVSEGGFLAAANNLSDVTNAATARQNLDLEIGVDVQAYDANLTAFLGNIDLPTSDGTTGQALVTNGLGTLSFGSAGISTGKAIAMAIVFG